MKKTKYNVQADGYHIEIPYTCTEVRKLIDEGKHIDKFKLKRERIEARSASFGKGGERIAFEGIFTKSEREIVLKRFNKERKFDVFIETIEKQCICSSLAIEFNQLHVTEKQIQFIPTTLFISNSFKGIYDEKILNKKELEPLIENGVFLVEPLLHGEFIKFNCNNGNLWFDSYHATLHAFSHWSWCISNHQLVIVDLQGIQIGNCFYLTDPAILSLSENKFSNSSTNLGENGISRFFETHYCNQICVALNINNDLYPKQIPDEIISTETPVNEQMSCVSQEPSRSLGKCVVLHPFKAEEINDLNLERDDIIEITAKEGDWWQGRCKGKEGIFPKNHVQELLKVFQFVCCSDYHAKNKDEIDVSIGDLVYLLGKKEGSVRVGLIGNEYKFGFIPFDIVQPIN
ncbi:elongation factor 2 kinase, putative [Entamoeba dispar SAW760]|uniref:Elongation factor 2 kinase, putative n=1 Tax=Entamoeba dispar (strain ATCC PRA-260 / SAW760) TaxID=370354 RepID=B0EJB6_ENTDS|nr:elongation factor 2 kinase, putative [Entamoeba dispar SAW760]EDR25424.1 elongation factor 2 kinase, putative [Entamoeba dispar SAW760]|eukprot:EDR25424.1 elongation factor 2 kinase, putative [Entamoeba dispar SAW760]